MSGLSLDRRSVLGGGVALSVMSVLPASAMQGDGSLPEKIDPAVMDLTFEDTFRRLDRARAGGTRWTTTYAHAPPDTLSSRTLKNNGEQQVYVDPELQGLGLNPFRITGRGLTIVADKTPQRARQKLWNMPFTSGVITSHGSFSQLYGYFEIRAQLPRGKGLWPAFWLMPVRGGWPPELDVMENLGADPSTYYGTAHSESDKGEHKMNPHKIATGVDLSAAPHAFGVAWTAEELVWYLDRREVARERTPAGLNTPLYLLANLAVGGHWGGPVDRSTRFPAAYHIEAIRVWQFKA